MKKQIKKFIPQDWQKNPEMIETPKVQLWSWSGTMITAQLTNADARKMVAEGRAFVITGQAVGLFEQNHN